MRILFNKSPYKAMVCVWYWANDFEIHRVSWLEETIDKARNASMRIYRSHSDIADIRLMRCVLQIGPFKFMRWA